MIGFFNKLLSKYYSWLGSLSKLRSRQGLYEFLSAEYSGIQRGSKVLTVGAGGEVNQLLAKHALVNEFDVVSVDIDPARGPEIVGDICKMSLPADAFDVVVLSEVLEHLHSPSDGLRNLHCALKHGGKLILTAPFILPMHDRPHDYFRFTKHGLELLLGNFRNVNIAARDSYFEAIDVLWLRLLQTNQRATNFLSCFLIPMVFYVKRPVTLLLGRFFASDAMTTGYVVTAVK